MLFSKLKFNLELSFPKADDPYYPVKLRRCMSFWWSVWGLQLLQEVGRHAGVLEWGNWGQSLPHEEKKKQVILILVHLKEPNLHCLKLVSDHLSFFFFFFRLCGHFSSLRPWTTTSSSPPFPSPPFCLHRLFPASIIYRASIANF